MATSSKAATKKTAAKKTVAKTTTAKKTPAKKTPAKTATKAATKKVVAKKASARTARTSTTDAIALLTSDHREAHQLFEDYQDLVDREADGAERQALAMQICAALTAHTTIEEEIFYPAAREALDEDDLLDEATVEHGSAKDLIAQIRLMSPDDDLYDAKVTVLGEYVDHHVDEEENEMFPRCRQTDLDLEALGEDLRTRKQELIGEVAA